MHIPKRYGQSKRQDCPFCSKPAITHNTQGVPTCPAHKDKQLNEIKCACGSWLELRQGNWGPYFNCIKCGNLSFAKGMARGTPATPDAKPTPTHITVRSDDPLYVDD